MGAEVEGRKRTSHREPFSFTDTAIAEGNSVSAVCLTFVLDALLDEFERGEEDGIHGAGAAHRHTKAAIHVALKELNLGRWLDLLAS